MATISEQFRFTPLPKKTIIVARADGRLYKVDFSDALAYETPELIDWNISKAKAIFGKFQHTRKQNITVEEIELENVVDTEEIATGEQFAVVIPYSLDGKNIAGTITPALAEQSGNYRHMMTRLTAKNFSIEIAGRFNLNTIQLKYHLAGNR